MTSIMKLKYYILLFDILKYQKTEYLKHTAEIHSVLEKIFNFMYFLYSFF